MEDTIDHGVVIEGSAGQHRQLNEALMARLEELNREIAAMRGLAKAKLREPSMFNGRKKNDVDRFLQQTQTYLSVCGVDQRWWPAYATTYFDGDVVLWWETHQVATNHVQYTWEEFCNVMRSQFRPLNYREEARRKATSMFQGKWTVYEYAQRFLREVNMVATMSEDDKMYHFRKGLREEIIGAMLNSNHQTVTEIIQEASTVESRLKEVSAMRSHAFKMQPPTQGYFTEYNYGGPTPMEIGSMTTLPRQSYRAALLTTRVAPPRLKNGPTTTAGKLDDKERQKCKDKGLCFKCRQPGHTWRNCPSGFRPSNTEHQ